MDNKFYLPIHRFPIVIVHIIYFVSGNTESILSMLSVLNIFF